MSMVSATKSVVSSRMSMWFYISIGLMVIVTLLAPQKLGMLIYKVNLITIAAWLGYWIDRLTFYYARPDQVPEALQAAANIRRAVIMAACILAMAIGL